MTFVDYSSAKSGFIEWDDILWFENKGDGVYELKYARKTSKKDKYVPASLSISVRNSDGDQDLVARVLEQAYENTKKQKRLLVLINPHGGPGKATSIYRKHGAPFFAAANCHTHVITTTHRYHAQEIAKDLDLSKYDAIVCCSGDGIPHEVMNGFAERPDAMTALATMPICQFPCGSGNSLAMSLNGTGSPSKAAVAIIKGSPMRVDLMQLSQENKTAVSFLSQTYGLVADCDLGTEDMRWMGGQRFAVGAVMRTLSATTYPCELYVKYAHVGNDAVKKHFNGMKQAKESSKGASQDVFTHAEGALTPPKFGTVNDNVPEDWTKLNLPDLSFFYVGKMPWMATDAFVFPACLPTDGCLDLITWDSKIGRVNSLQLLLQLEEGQHIHSKQAHYSKIEAYRLIPKIPKGYLSIDGESYDFKPFQVEVLPAAGCLLSMHGIYANREDL